ncbi:M3 family oligoendopeptidase [Alicyclobacillus fastidiosus]|uniref:M3 family oligoendopeptidase n=1 Tax=Alicyclobacillus fastidiosus TaxID=392011 RepID=A0ABV5AK96_9BACL
MKLADMAYERPDFDAARKMLADLVQVFRTSPSLADQKEIMFEIDSIRSRIATMSTLCNIRHSVDTYNEFYKEEKRVFDHHLPILETVVADYYRALVESPFRGELEQYFGQHIFRLAELSIQTFKPEMIEDMQRDNELSTQYNALVASASLAFDGRELNLSQLGKYLNSPDRDVRKAANEVKYRFFASHEEQFDAIYDRLVRCRTNMAQKIGYETFTKLGYARLHRTDYNAQTVEQFRAEVLTHIVPLAEKLKERQRNRIGVEQLRYYDEGFHFTTRNPAPKGDPEWILAQGKKMYSELSPETDEFFRFMTDNELMDLLSKRGKRVGGYCTVIPDAKAPFIFANFNGTAHDVSVLTHEAGHAFMAYVGRDVPLQEYRFPTLEAAEIHSISMEFFTWDWMNLFFREDAGKFQFYHLSSAVTTIPYLVTVDEFQHFVYEHPNASPAERKAAWRDIERRYIPHRNYEGNDYLERGGYWQQQLHIFGRPFYYIDYALAQICALQFWARMQHDKTSAWSDYLRLCTLAGSQSFVDLVEAANLTSPFQPGCVEAVVREVECWLDAVDDASL